MKDKRVLKALERQQQLMKNALDLIAFMIKHPAEMPVESAVDEAPGSQPTGEPDPKKITFVVEPEFLRFYR